MYETFEIPKSSDSFDDDIMPLIIADFFGLSVYSI
jgi:hypothetical protein